MSKIELVTPTESALCYIASHLRTNDREELFCVRWSDDPGALVTDCMGVIARPSSITTIAKYERRPVAVLGGVEIWPGAWDVWAFGTDEFDKVGFALTRYVRRRLIPYLLHKGMRRAHCNSLASHTKSHEWLRDLGARPEDERPMKNWGKNGEDFIMFEWHRELLLKSYPMEAA